MTIFKISNSMNYRFYLTVLCALLGLTCLSAQTVSLPCQLHSDGTIGLDRNNFTGGSTDILSEGIMHNFLLPSNTFGGCKKIESIDVDITVTNIDESNLPADCNVFDYFINFSDNCGTFDPASCNDIFAQIQGTPVSQSVTYTCPPQDFGFDDFFGVDVVPAMADVNCSEGQSTISSGSIIMEYEICVTVILEDATPTDIVDLGPDVQACPTGTVQIDAGSFDTYIWDPNGEITQMIDAAPGNYTVTVTDITGCTSTDDIEVTAFPVSNISFDPANPMACEGGDVLVSVSESYPTYQWSNGLSGQNQLLSPGNYDVTITDSNNCTAVESVTVDEVIPPNAGNNNFIEVCADGTLYNMDIQLGTHDIGGTWSNDDSGIDVNLSPFAVDFTGVTSSTYNFTYTVTGSAPCMDDQATITVNVNEPSNAGVDNIYSNCADPGFVDVFDLLGNPDSGGDFNDGGLGLDFTNPNSVDFDGIPQGTYLIVYSFDADGECMASEATLTLDLADGANAGAFASVTVCEGVNLDLGTLIEVGADLNGEFSDPSGVGGLTGSIVNTTGLAGMTFFYNYQVGDPLDPCGADVAVFTVSIESSLLAGDNATDELCIGGTINLDDYLTNADLGGTYDDLDGGGGLVGNMLNTDLIAPGVYNYEYSIGDGVTCPIETALIELTFREGVEGMFDSESLDICYSTCDSITISISGQGPFSCDFSVQELDGIILAQNTLTNENNLSQLYICNDQLSIGFSNDTLNIGDTDSLLIILENVEGAFCDSELIDTVLISSLPQNVFNLDTSICILDTLVINGQEFFLGNSTYIDTLDGIRCDSFININVSFDDADTSFVNEIICAGDSINLFSTWFSETYTSDEFTVSNATGCDSVFVVDVSFYPSANTVIDTTLCSGDFIIVDGDVYDESNLMGMTVLEGASVNGCDSTVVVMVTYANDINVIRNDTLCAGEIIMIGGNTFDESNPMGQFVILGSGGCDTLVDVNLTFVQPATNLIDGTFCSDFDTIVNGTIYNIINPSDIETIVGGNYQGCDSIITIDLMFYPEATNLIDTILCIGESLVVNGDVYDESNLMGTTVIPAVSQFGCDSTVTISVDFYPMAEGNIDTTLCIGQNFLFEGVLYDESNNSGVAVLNNASQFGCDSTVFVMVDFFNVSMANNNAVICSGDSIFLMNAWQFDPGIYMDTLMNSSGCDSIITTTLTVDPCAIDVTINSVGNACIGGVSGGISITIDSEVDVPFSIILLNQNTNQEVVQVVDVFETDYEIGGLLSGNYLLSINDSDGTTIYSSSILIDDLFPELTGTWNLIDDIVCNGELANLEFVAFGGNGNYFYQWSDAELGDEALISNIPASNYMVTITDGNGCSFDSSFEIVEPSAITFDTDGFDVSCDGVEGGSIEVNNIGGGSDPYTILINGQEVNEFIINDLAAGNYSIQVTDNDGCESEVVTLELLEAEDVLLVDYILEYDINLGDSIELSGDILEDNLSFDWLAESSLSCIDCESPIASPLITTNYQLTISNAEGCTQEILITVNVSEDIIVLTVPNVFSPNGDGVNDEFIFGNEGIAALELTVFDRWGGIMHNSTSEDGFLAWDGKSDGNDLSIGVYVYQLVVEYLDGSTEVRVSDITIVK